MITRDELQEARLRARQALDACGVALRGDEAEGIEVADFGLSDLPNTGLQLVTYVNTARCCAKELVLFPGQTCPEHRHPPVAGELGKEETFRCRAGLVYLYVPGAPTANPRARPPAGKESTYSVWHEVILRPGEQHTIPPDTLHWFQAGDEGAVVSEFSTTSRDEFDIFTDQEVERITLVAGVS